MKHLTATLLLAAGLAVSAPAHAQSDDAATACVRAKAWEARQQGWNLRALDASSLRPGELRAWPLALAPGLTYRILTCGEEGITALDVLLVDGNGNVVARAADSGREPTLEHKPETPSRVHLVVRPREAKTGDALHTAIAVLYR